jgi:hypothetical protein
VNTIRTRESIARNAEAAALVWSRNPHHPKPANPHDAFLEPEHHREWQASFERFLVQFTAPECEASA